MTMTSSQFHSNDLIPGTPYRILKQIGKGGHGVVYSVEHTFLQSRGAMKLLNSEHGQDADIVRRTKLEMRTLARMEHPNLVKVRDGGLTAETPSRPFFVMEELRGMSLRETIRKVPGGLGIAGTLPIIIGVLDGLSYAHTQYAVVHRDIKPDNIFIHRTEMDTSIAKILDFGVAHFTMERRHTGRGFIGTPRYSAPEQILGERPTPKTDLYALGAVLYECLTGQSMFADCVEMAVIHAHLQRVPRRLRALMSDVPPDLDDLVACLLEKDPVRRPESAAAAAQVLRKIKSRFEEEARVISDVDECQTEPTPMENLLITTVARDFPSQEMRSDQEGERASLALASTDVPAREKATEKDGSNELDLPVRGANTRHDTVPMQPPYDVAYEESAAGVDRQAETREARVPPFTDRIARNGTQKIKAPAERLERSERIRAQDTTAAGATVDRTRKSHRGRRRLPRTVWSTALWLFGTAMAVIVGATLGRSGRSPAVNHVVGPPAPIGSVADGVPLSSIVPMSITPTPAAPSPPRSDDAESASAASASKPPPPLATAKVPSRRPRPVPSAFAAPPTEPPPKQGIPRSMLDEPMPSEKRGPTRPGGRPSLSPTDVPQLDDMPRSL